MAEKSVSGVVRDILTSDPEMQTDEVIRRGNGNPDGSVFHIDDQPVELKIVWC